MIYVTFAWFLPFLFISVWNYQYSRKQCMCRKKSCFRFNPSGVFPKGMLGYRLDDSYDLPIAVVEQESDPGGWFRQSTDKPYSDQLTTLTSLHDKLVFQSFGGQQVWSRQRTSRSSGIYLYVFDHCCIQKYILCDRISSKIYVMSQTFT